MVDWKSYSIFLKIPVQNLVNCLLPTYVAVLEGSILAVIES